MAANSSFATTARTDHRDWLIHAEEPMAGLQLRIGGELPGVVAAPSLLEAVRHVRETGIPNAGAIRIRDVDDWVTAWVEVSPDAEGSGCTLTVSNWSSVPAEDTDSRTERERQIALARQFAELTARLGPKQELLDVESACPELSDLVQQMRAGLGKAWTEFVKISGTSSHWRLLDGAEVMLSGSSRKWRATIVPCGKPRPGSDGFELYLVARTPLADEHPQQDQRAKGDQNQDIGVAEQVAPVLRRPVSRIVANAETIRAQLAGPLAEEYSEYAADIATAGEHLLSLVDDLATLEAVDGAALSLTIDDVDLADLATQAAGILRVRSAERQITIDTPKTGETAPARGDVGRILQILFNLVGNAIRYSPIGSQIWVRVETEKMRSRVIVADQGEGLDDEEQIRVFEKFERLGKSGDGGSGLGLYISRKLAVAMKGSLTVESSKGQGARFILELPTGA